MKLAYLVSALVLSGLTLSAHAGTEMTDTKAKDPKAMVPPARSTTDAGFYGAVFGGAQFLTDYGNQKQTITIGGTTFNTNANVQDGWGAAGGIKFGYNFESFDVSKGLRLQPGVEVEGLYLGTTAKITGGTPGVSAVRNTSFNSAAGFVNGILRFKLDSPVTPYIGLGVGGQMINEDTNAQINGVNTGHQDSAGAFAAQALAGVDIAVCNHVSIFTEYKFIDAIGVDIETPNVGGSGRTLNFKPDQIQQHLIVAGVKYSF